MTNNNDRFVPINDLDFQMQTTQPQWGREAHLHEGLRGRVVKKTNWVDNETGEVVRSDLIDQWSIGSMSTQDVRLGNLSSWNGEFEVSQFFQDWAMDTLRAFMEDDDSGHVAGAPWVASNRVENLIELSHSKSGFFRKQMNTFTTESRTQEIGPPKKSLMGGNNNKRGGY